MSNPSRLVLAFLLALFTFNQVALAHLFPADVNDVESACFEHDTEDESAGLPLNLNQSLFKHIGCTAAVVVLYIVCSDEKEGQRLHRTSPHGQHVPIYLDHRALIV